MTPLDIIGEQMDFLFNQGRKIAGEQKAIEEEELIRNKEGK